MAEWPTRVRSGLAGGRRRVLSIKSIVVWFPARSIFIGHPRFQKSVPDNSTGYSQNSHRDNPENILGRQRHPRTQSPSEPHTSSPRETGENHYAHADPTRRPPESRLHRFNQHSYVLACSLILPKPLLPIGRDSRPVPQLPQMLSTECSPVPRKCFQTVSDWHPLIQWRLRRIRLHPATRVILSHV